MKTKYSILKNKNTGLWVVWKDIEAEQSIGSYSIFSGTKKECEDYLERVKKDDKKNSKEIKKTIKFIHRRRVA